MQDKILRLRTNYNGKLSCFRFIHLDISPSKSIRESDLTKMFFKIEVDDHSHDPIRVKMYDLARLKLKELTETYTSLSHGMDLEEYVNHLIKNRPNVSPDTEIGVYYYEKIVEG